MVVLEAYKDLSKFLHNFECRPSIQLRYMREIVCYIKDMMFETKRMHEIIFASQSTVATQHNTTAYKFPVNE